MPSFCVSSLVLFFIFYLFPTFPEASHPDGSSLAISLSMRLFQNGSGWGFTDFIIPIFSQTLIAPALIRFLKSLISFKVILDIALVTSSVSCFSRNAFADHHDVIGSFFGFFCNSFSRFVISLTLSLT